MMWHQMFISSLYKVNLILGRSNFVLVYCCDNKSSRGYSRGWYGNCDKKIKLKFELKLHIWKVFGSLLLRHIRVWTNKLSKAKWVLHIEFESENEGLLVSSCYPALISGLFSEAWFIRSSFMHTDVTGHDLRGWILFNDAQSMDWKKDWKKNEFQVLFTERSCTRNALFCEILYIASPRM